jgi:type II secretory pathway pseudopilin PulG
MKMRRLSGRADREAGDTLIEVLVAVVIMGIAFVVIVGGIGTAIIGAAVQQNQATADSVLKTAAETVTGETAYKPCATPTDYPPPAAPAGFSTLVTSVAFWNPTSNLFDTACTTDSGLQLVTLTVSSTNVHAPATATLEVVKRQ